MTNHQFFKMHACRHTGFAILHKMQLKNTHVYYYFDGVDFQNRVKCSNKSLSKDTSPFEYKKTPKTLNGQSMLYNVSVKRRPL